MKSRDFLTALN